MATFEDTPKWKTRQAYERAKTRSKRRRAPNEKRIAAAQERRWDNVTVRYECPICGSDHSRADHRGATNVSIFNFDREEAASE